MRSVYAYVYKIINDKSQTNTIVTIAIKLEASECTRSIVLVSISENFEIIPAKRKTINWRKETFIRSVFQERYNNLSVVDHSISPDVQFIL